MGCVGSKPQVANGNAGAGAKKQAPKVVPKKSVNTTKNEQFKSNVEETVRKDNFRKSSEMRFQGLEVDFEVWRARF
jgi:hypothetical protein